MPVLSSSKPWSLSFRINSAHVTRSLSNRTLGYVKDGELVPDWLVHLCYIKHHATLQLLLAAGVGEWRGKMEKIAARIRQIGVSHVLYGSDGVVGPGRKPEEA